MIKKILHKIGDNQFYNAIKITLCALSSFLLFYDSQEPYVAFTVTLGALLCAPIDISSKLKHKIIGLLIATLLLPIISIVLTTTYKEVVLFYPIFSFLVFFSALISLYGHRANLLSFTLLIGISLAFIHHNEPENALQNGMYMFFGGMLYLLFSIVFYIIRPSRYINLEVALCIHRVSEYLDLRAKLWDSTADTESIKHKQLELQITINESFDNIREYLVYNKAKTINSSNNRKLLVALTSLVEIMELAMSNTFNNQQIVEYFESDPTIMNDYKQLASNFSTTLESISYHIKSNKKYHSSVSLTNDFKSLNQKIETFTKNNGWSPIDEKTIAINNVLFYAEKQIEKIKGLERVYKERVNADELRGKYKDLEKFFTPEHYRFKTLVEHLNFESATFRYALRLTAAMLLGLIIGKFINLQNEYWILLTIVVIMRPGYGLTKQRSKHRIIGTILGGILGILLLIFVDNIHILSIITIFSMLFGYWLSASDYRIGVTFVTLYVILIYGILNAEAESAFIYRLLDTSIGAGIAFLATHFFWPSWEFYNVKNHLEKSLKSIITYVEEVKQFYVHKGEPTTAYKIARKNAFIEVGNLMASFQRMIQEPKNKQQNRTELYELAVLNQTLVSSTASMGTFIQSHKTTEASEAFKIVMDNVQYNLKSALLHLDINISIDENVKNNFEISITKLKNIRKEEVESLPLSLEEKIQKTEESQLIIDQLIWMVNLSEQIEKVCKKIK
ncbi:MAG TPA: FUSC family membrane protein [Flavobacterium sp.]|nr:FUSC family membrane protein [Flavobacterium sp.]